LGEIPLRPPSIPTRKATPMLTKEQAAKIVDILEQIYPDAQCALQSGGEDWKLLIMGRLSAQCTDARVNIVCKTLFTELPTLQSVAECELSRLEELVKPCGLYKTKAKNIKDAAIMLINEYHGKVPDTMEDLLRLPDVGRKIANLLLGDLYHKPAIVTDTHCIRICGRLGFYPESLKDPLKVEKILVPLIEPTRQSDFCHRLVQFGRDTCMARSPLCGDCLLNGVCLHWGIS